MWVCWVVLGLYLSSPVNVYGNACVRIPLDLDYRRLSIFFTFLTNYHPFFYMLSANLGPFLVHPGETQGHSLFLK